MERPCLLVVDDDEGLSAILRLLLNRAGYDAALVYSGTEALEWLATRRPTGILLDVMMPDMSGLELLQTLRAQPATHALPIFMLTAYVDDKNRAALHAAGATACLTKPISQAELTQVLTEKLGKAGK